MYLNETTPKCNDTEHRTIYKVLQQIVKRIFPSTKLLLNYLLLSYFTFDKRRYNFLIVCKPK